MLTTDSVSGPGGTSFKTREYVYDALRGVLTDIKLSGSTTSLTTNGNLVSTALAMPGGASLGRQLGSTSAAIKDTTESTNNNYLERWLGINYPGQIDRHLRWTAKVGRWFDYDSLGQLLKGRTMVRNPGATLPGGCPTADFGMSGSCTPLADYGTVDSLVYSYDAAGNRTDQSGAYTTGNRMTTFASCSYKTDAEGNVVRRSGSSPCVQIDSLFWTAEGQLDSVKLGSTGLKYRYDAAGRLVQKRVNGSSSSYFLWEGDNLLAELNGTASSVKAEYSYYPGLDNLQALIVGGTVYYARTDGLGSVLALSDTTKAVKSTYEYDDWGHLTVGGDSASFNGVDRARWKGALWLGSEVELYYMRNRWYEPYSGRFLSEDPIGLAGGINPAVFAGNDPVNRRDPSGRQGVLVGVCFAGTGCGGGSGWTLPFNWPTDYELPWGVASGHPVGDLTGIGRGALPGAKAVQIRKEGPSCAGWSLDKTRQSDVATVTNPIETYETFRATRSAYQFLFPGIDNSTPRHLHASYELTRRFGALATWTFGLLNEIEGFVLHDLPNLQSRLEGRSPWAFQLSDLESNARGIIAATVGSCPHNP